MAYDERLAERVRAALAGERGISERKMFGGLAFLVDGKMCVGVLHDELMVRTGRERYAEALRRPHARPMDFTGRATTGMVYAGAPGIARSAALQRWLELALTAAREASASRRRTTKRAVAARRPARRAGSARRA